MIFTQPVARRVFKAPGSGGRTTSTNERAGGSEVGRDTPDPMTTPKRTFGSVGFRSPQARR